MKANLKGFIKGQKWKYKNSEVLSLIIAHKVNLILLRKKKWYLMVSVLLHWPVLKLNN